MKHSLILLFISTAIFNGNVCSQAKVKPLDSNTSTATKSGGKVHKGFYARFGVGPVFGKVKYVDTGNFNASGEIRGTGAAIELLLGGAVNENLIIHFDLLSRAVVDPEVNINGSSFMKTEDFSFGEVTYGIGGTYYFMPINIYTSASIGTGAFIFSDDKTKTTKRTDFGFSFALKAGKMFWLGKHFGIGAGIGYGHTGTKTEDSGITETLNSNRMFITGALSFN